jgi:hypothetical protein
MNSASPLLWVPEAPLLQSTPAGEYGRRSIPDLWQWQFATRLPWLHRWSADKRSLTSAIGRIIALGQIGIDDEVGMIFMFHNLGAGLRCCGAGKCRWCGRFAEITG